MTYPKPDRLLVGEGIRPAGAGGLHVDSCSTWTDRARSPSARMSLARLARAGCAAPAAAGAAIAERVEQILGGAPVRGQLTVDDVVTVVLALSNGLAIEQYADPGFVSDGLFGRVLAQL